ncbi:MAG TPA: glycoside hydrolase family 27 protein [Bryobacteraceae bacterium]|nr:glycoside hydrolase family 27 protein [Bryobacteraceae bacterium]
MVHAQTDLAGFWVFKVPRGDGTFSESYFELKQSGETITGNTVGGRAQLPIDGGAFRDGKLRFTVSFTGRGGQPGATPPTFTTVYEGTLQGGKFAMTMTGGRAGRNGRGPSTGEFERAKAEAAMPPAKIALPELHDIRDNKLARTPPMGWNSWNKFAGAIDDKAVRGIADAMVSSGMQKAGYEYVNIDDTWELDRDANGNITTNTKFPDMKALADYVHSKGLKIGIYSSPGPKTCAGYVASYGHEEQDARTFSAWGIDYLKYDWCSAGTIYSDAEMQAVYQKMGDALLKSRRPILYSLCQYGNNKVWEWGAKVGGNSWRTTGDINDSWQSLDRIGFGTAVPGGIHKQGEPGPPALTQYDIAQSATVGHWNDPDMLEVGNGHMTTDEYKTHFSLWCLLRAPLLAGNDLRDMTDDTKSILMNTDVIAIDQDRAGLPLHRVSQEGNTVVFMRPLKGGDIVVGMFNRGDQPAEIGASWDSLGVAGKRLQVRDLWKHAAVTVNRDRYTDNVPMHGVVILRVTAK